jgi:uncharacterized protein YjiK
LIAFIYCQDNTSILQCFNINSKHARRIELDKDLREVSGLALSKEGKLFCHNDEKGIVYQVDLNTGDIIKRFKLGILTINRDFEDIAIVKDTFYLLTSDGILFRFKEGQDKESVKYKGFKTGLNKKNNVEGLCYDPETNCLLLACKEDPGDGYKKYRAVYAYSLTENKLITQPRFLLPLKKMEKFSKENKFEPSGITRHPQTGHFFLIAAGGSMIIEISKSGEIIAMEHLKEKYHSQPEGIVFKSDNELLICDEARKDKGTITFYEFESK